MLSTHMILFDITWNLAKKYDQPHIVDAVGHHPDILKDQATHSPSFPQVLAVEGSCLTPYQELLSTKDSNCPGSHFLLQAACIQWLIDVDYQDSVPSLNITERPSHLQSISSRLSWGLCCSITVHQLCPVLSFTPYKCVVPKSIGQQTTQIIKTRSLFPGHPFYSWGIWS